MVQVLILAAVAAFLFWRLSIVLGVRTGFEKPLEIKIKTSDSNNDTGLEAKSNEKQCSILDIFPTVLELAGIDYSLKYKIEGENLLNPNKLLEEKIFIEFS